MELSVAALVAIAVALIAFRVGLARSERYPTVPGASPGGSTPETVEGLIGRGRKIDAIKRYREERGVGLREAKEAVEALERTLRGQTP